MTGNIFLNNGIIESGSNENGSYIKYNDGTMICYGTQQKTSTISAYYNTLTRSDYLTINFPISFIEPPSVTITPYGHQAIGLSIGNGNLNSDYVKFWILKANGATDTGCEYCYQAIGKWK